MPPGPRAAVREIMLGRKADGRGLVWTVRAHDGVWRGC
ncbi:hypothetical protein STXM2123_2092 [Streptomyces sp. F-3]|nr:hypothetical protein STXM2123_2092 [Streptomyces sp. F-3]